MLAKMKKIWLSACSVLAAVSVASGLCAVSNVQNASADTAKATYVATDTATKSAWESAGYGTEGYLIFGVNDSNKPAAYSNMYTEQNNDGKTEITLYKHTDNSYYYDSNLTTTDSTAPISKFVVNGQSAWQQIAPTYWVDQPDLYAPGTETLESVRMHNNHDGDAYHDYGIGFTLTATEKTQVSVYVLDWSKKVSLTAPITVGLFSGIKATTVYGYGNNAAETMQDQYGEALAEATVMNQGSYVTFAIEGAGDYQIVAYYDNADPEYTSAPITPMLTGLFFDSDEGESGGNDGVPESPVNDILVDTKTKSAWEDGGYGQAGYMVFGANASNKPAVYSDMYTEQGNDGKTEITLYKHGNNSIYYDSNLTTTDRTAPISGFVVNGSSAWQQIAPTYWISQPDLYIPGTETYYPVRMHNNMADPYHDIGVGFTLTATEKTYVSVYVMDWSKRVNDSNIITIGLYSGIQATTFYGYGNNSAETLDEHYGTALIETTVTCQGAYVTFAIEGAGDYQIVAYYDSQDLDEAAPVTPMMTGLFFDTELPAAQEENVIIPGEGEYVGYEANYTGADWERLGYGTDGYVVYYTEDDTTYQAYTKGIYKNADGSDYTGLVTYSDAVKDAHNDWKADKELSGKLITRYASAFGEFSTIAGKSWKDDFATGVLTVPGTKTPTWTRISTPRYEGDGATAFTIPASAFEKYDAIDVTVFHTTAFGPADKAANFKTALFNMYDCGNGDNANTMSGYLLSSATIELSVNGPLYVTYRITSPGDYTLFLMSDDENVVRATTTGIFFDYVTGVMSNITYEADGGTHTNPSTYVEGTLLPLTDASKDGYTFDGWYTDSEFKNKVTEIPVDTTGDITIYAKFNRIYQTFNITYELDGGEHSNPATYTEGTGLVLTDASKDGYNFIGWYTDKACTVKVTEILAEQTGDITLYAKFAKIPEVYNITYVADGGVHGNPESYTEGSAVALTNAMKTGYTFDGWYLDGEFNEQITEISAEQTGDITLYAKFTKILQTFNVTYETDGGEHSNPATYTEGTAVALEDASKEGYTFDGWYTDSAFENEVTEISATQTGDITLYAKFTEIVVPGPDDSSEPNNSEILDSDSTNSNENSEGQSSGCVGTISLGVAGIMGILLAAGALIAKKKED